MASVIWSYIYELKVDSHLYATTILILFFIEITL